MLSLFPMFSRRASTALLCTGLVLAASGVMVSGQAMRTSIPKVKGKSEDRIWTALVLASNVGEPREPAPELRSVASTVEKFFGYNQVQLIGSAVKNVDEAHERWLVPSQNFWVSVKSKRAPQDEYLLDLVLFHDRRRLVETEAKLGRESPLFIRGPVHAKGQILIVLQVMP